MDEREKRLLLDSMYNPGMLFLLIQMIWLSFGYIFKINTSIKTRTIINLTPIEFNSYCI